MSRLLLAALLLPARGQVPSGELACWGATPESSAPSDLGPLLEVATGGHFTCARREAEPGRPVCWGETLDVLNVPSGLVDAERLYVGAWHACARRNGGVLTCWGAISGVPTLLDAPAGAIEAAALGWKHSVAVVSGGGVVCWGDNSRQQCDVPAALSAKAVAAGGWHSCAVAADDTVQCWGYDSYGALTVPPQLGTVTALASGGYTNCALATAGGVMCWGRYPSPPVFSSAPESFVAGDNSLCGLANGDAVGCWGADASVEAEAATKKGLLALGLGNAHGCALFSTTTTSTTTLPVGELNCWGTGPEVTNTPSGLGPLLEVQAGGHFSCVRTLAEPGRPVCWGDPLAVLSVPTQLTDAVQLYLGAWHACARRQSGSLLCWGSHQDEPTLTDMPTNLGNPDDVSLGWQHTLALVGGSIVCWGNDAHGQCSTPSDLAGKVRNVHAGGWHSCAVTREDEVRCWGNSDHNALSVPADLKVRNMASKGYNNCAVKVDGTPVCWGRYAAGMVSFSQNPERFLAGDAAWCGVVGDDVVGCWGTPVEVVNGALALVTAPALTIGGGNGCALITTSTTTTTPVVGGLHCWGKAPESSYPENLGPLVEMQSGGHFNCVRTLTEPGRPVCWGEALAVLTVPSHLTDVVRMYLGAWHACARRADNSVACWGVYSGVATLTDVPSGTIDDIDLGWKHTVALINGGVVCWGDNSKNQCDVPSDLTSNVHTVRAGGWHSCAVTREDAVRCWGHSDHSVLAVPSDLGRVRALYAMAYTNCVIKADGGAACWGKYPNMPSFSRPPEQFVIGDGGQCGMAGTEIVGCWGQVSTTFNGAAALGEALSLGLGAEHGCALLTITTTSTTSSSSSSVSSSSSSTSRSTSSTGSSTSSASTTTFITTTAGTTAQGTLTEGTTIGVRPVTTIGVTTASAARSTGVATSTGAAISAPGTTAAAVADKTTEDEAIAATSGAPSGAFGSATSTGVDGTSAAAAAVQNVVVGTSSEPAAGGAFGSTGAAIGPVAAPAPAAVVLGDATGDNSSTAEPPSSSLSPATTTATSTATASSTEPVPTAKPSAARAAEGAVQEAIAQGLTALREANVTTLKVSTAAGVLTLLDVGAAAAAGSAQVVEQEAGGRVLLPQALLQALPAGAVLSVLSVEENGTAFEGLGALAGPVMDISISDDGRPVKLPRPLLFKLPGTAPGNAECVFLDTAGVGPPRWSSEGVWRASRADVEAAGQVSDGIWCFTEHLSIFAALLRAVLGCTNLELFSREALRAVEENEGWSKTEAAGIVFFVWALLLFAVIIGNLWERWSLRWGRTSYDGQKVNLCRRFVNWGPQMLKHKYVIFVVYTRDILRWASTGYKLKSTILTSSVQRILAVRSGVSVACITGHCWSSGGWIEPKASLPMTVLMTKLECHAGKAETVIRTDIMAPGVLGVLWRFLLTVLAMHPLLDSLRLGAGSLTVAKRVVLQAAGICGVIGTNALIFNFSGSLRSWEADAECPIEHTSHFFILVATLVSVTVNALPNAFLMDVAKQVHGRPAWTCVFWAWTLFYLTGGCLLILVAVANLNEVDQGKWYNSLEWGMSIKLVWMPIAQGLRHELLLELFLWEDRRCEPDKRFQVTMGLMHANEKELSLEIKQQVATTASQAISAEELLTFVSMLGDKVMPDFDPRTTSSEAVLQGGVRAFCAHAPSLEELPVKVTIKAFAGPAPDALACSVLHLGALARGERPCLWQQETGAGMSTCVRGLETQHALGFAAKDAKGGEVLGMACMPAEELLRAGGFSGQLQLQPLRGGGFSEAPAVRHRAVSGSRGPECIALEVEVEVPQGYLPALAARRFREARSGFLSEPSEVEHHEPMRHELSKAFALKSHPSRGSYVVNTGEAPPEKLVVHSRRGTFLHLAASVLADALGPGSYKRVESMLLDREHHGLLELLKEKGVEGWRYWMELFATDPLEHEEGNCGWHEGYLEAWPVMLRAARLAWCRRASVNIKNGALVAEDLRPPGQLVVLDRDCHLLRDLNCLAELMIAKALRTPQRLTLAPGQMREQGAENVVGNTIKRLGAANEEDMGHTVSYLRNKQAVYETVWDLVIRAAKEQEKEEGANGAPWTELSAANLAAAAAALHSERESHSQQAGADNLDVDLDADVDADV